MKKHIFILCWLCSFSISLFSQQEEDTFAVYLRNFQYQKALDYLETMLVDRDISMKKVTCYKALGDNGNVVQTLELLLLDYPHDIQIQAELAMAYQITSRLNKSVQLYDQLIQQDSLNSYFRIQKADVLYQQTNYKDALGIYRQALETRQSTQLLKRVAMCFEKMNEPDSAMTYYKRSWEINASDSFAAASLINLCLKNKRALEAKEYSDAYLLNDSTDRQINLLNALSYYTLDLYEEAVLRFERCRQAGDSSLIVNRSLGIAYYSLNENQKAYLCLDKAYTQDSTNMNVLYCLARTAHDLSLSPKAIASYTMLLEKTIPPDMTLYLYYRGLAMAYEQSRQDSLAVEGYVQALKYGNANQKMPLYYSLAQLYELYLNDNMQAYHYYMLYRDSLHAYLMELKQTKEGAEDEIGRGEQKIEGLDEYIARLKLNIDKR